MPETELLYLHERRTYLIFAECHENYEMKISFNSPNCCFTSRIIVGFIVQLWGFNLFINIKYSTNDVTLQ